MRAICRAQHGPALQMRNRHHEYEDERNKVEEAHRQARDSDPGPQLPPNHAGRRDPSGQDRPRMHTRNAKIMIMR